MTGAIKAEKLAAKALDQFDAARHAFSTAAELQAAAAADARNRADQLIDQADRLFESSEVNERRAKSLANLLNL